MSLVRALVGAGFLALVAVTGCSDGKKKAHDATSESSSDDSAEVRVEYVPIAINWVRRHVKATPAEISAWEKTARKGDPGNDSVSEAQEAYKKAHAPELARKLADEMLSRMQASSESLDAIAEKAIREMLGPAAISDAKRRKAVSMPASRASEADLPPDAKEAFAAFARKAKPGDVVDSPLGSGPVLVVARAAR